MVREESEFSIQKMAQLLKARKLRGRTVLFLGARAGGLFRSQAFYKNMQAFSLREFDKLTTFEQFAECYRALTKDKEFGETDIDNILTQALKGIAVLYADICVAELLKEGIFDLVITTCIDDILEQALGRVELKESYDFSVYSSRNDLTMQTPNSIERGGLFRVWKVFGDLVSKEYNITRRTAYTPSSLDLQKILEETRNRDILMVGFDHTWDKDLLPALFPRHPSSSLWFINDQKTEEDMSIAQYLVKHQSKGITGTEGSYENFFENLYWYITHKIMPIPFQMERDILHELRVIKENLKEIQETQHELKRLILQLSQKEMSDKSVVESNN